MEFKEMKNHYLHPDFEGVDNEKKPSPLALLLQTCKNVGSVGNKEPCIFNQTFSPNSSSTGFIKLSKRSHSNSSSNSSMTERDYLSPTKRSKLHNKISKKKKSDIIELKNADTSSETSYYSNSSLLNNLLQFVKNSNNIQLSGNDKMELIHFLAGQYNEKEKPIDVISQTKTNHFNVENGYHLESSEESNKLNYNNRVLKVSAHYPEDKNIVTENCQESLDFTKSQSAIKYCMYCGKFIPLLPILLTHIRFEHGNANFTDSSLQSASNMQDILYNFNLYPTSTETNSNRTFSFLTDYFSSSFQGMNNLIC